MCVLHVPEGAELALHQADLPRPGPGPFLMVLHRGERIIQRRAHKVPLLVQVGVPELAAVGKQKALRCQCRREHDLADLAQSFGVHDAEARGVPVPKVQGPVGHVQARAGGAETHRIVAHQHFAGTSLAKSGAQLEESISGKEVDEGT